MNVRTIVLFESPRRVAATLSEAAEVLGDRRAAVARELTKLHEEVLRGRISELLLSLGHLRGEVVIVLEGATEGTPVDLPSLVEQARALMGQGMRKREAATAQRQAAALQAQADKMRARATKARAAQDHTYERTSAVLGRCERRELSMGERRFSLSLGKAHRYHQPTFRYRWPLLPGPEC